MSVLMLNPAYQHTLSVAGLTRPEAFLRLSGEITAGHPDRHVRRLHIPDGTSQLPVYLKREHRCRWRDRWRNFTAGFGFVSRSVREWKTLCELQKLDVGCAEPLAAGEDAVGQAFLLLRQVPDAVELRYCLDALRSDDRAALLEDLGRALARLHATGYCHFDLYSKHVLVYTQSVSLNRSFVLLDWQRSFRMRSLPWNYRQRDLACLGATLPKVSYSLFQRTLLVSYLDTCRREDQRCRPGQRHVAEQIKVAIQRLARRRNIRELCQPPLPSDAQNLIWLQGEALCVTRRFVALCRGSIPVDFQPYQSTTQQSAGAATLSLLGRELSNSIHEQHHSWLNWPCRLTGRRKTAPGLHDAATLFRLERFHVAVPELLAFGQQAAGFGRLVSFLLTQPQAHARRLQQWLGSVAGSTLESRSWRRKVLASAGETVRQIHSADCVLGRHAQLVFLDDDKAQPRVGVDSVAGMRPYRRVSLAARHADLRRLLVEFRDECSATDKLRFLLSYLRARRLTPSAKRIIRLLMVPAPRSRSRLMAGRT